MWFCTGFNTRSQQALKPLYNLCRYFEFQLLCKYRIFWKAQSYLNVVSHQSNHPTTFAKISVNKNDHWALVILTIFLIFLRTNRTNNILLANGKSHWNNIIYEFSMFLLQIISQFIFCLCVFAMLSDLDSVHNILFVLIIL
jgi:hypothetical protein